MGYGMAFSVPLLANRDRRFDIVPDHYRIFNLEPGPASAMDLVVDVPSQDGRFGTFLELIQLLDRYAAQQTVLVVNHGASDANDYPIGLSLPLISGSPWNPDQYTLGLLRDFVGKNPSDSDYAAAESGSSMQSAQGQTIRMAAGTLKPLDTALRSLRAKKLKRVELRACNLGGNSTVMKLLAMVLGVDFIVAPSVHMFYLRLPAAGIRPDTAANFNQWVRNHAPCRTFTDTASSRRVAIRVNGRHADRTVDIDADDLDVKWFIDNYVCIGSPYVSRPPGRNAFVKPFSFSGMDFNHSFVLAREDDYVGQLVEETP